MPTPTYVPLANITLGSSASSVTFSSIPGTYRDLILVSAPLHASGAGLRLTINGSTADGSYVIMYGLGGGSYASGTGSFVLAATSDTAQSTNVLQVMDYSSTDKHKTFLLRSDRAGSGTLAYGQRWAQTAAITSLALVPDTGVIASGSTFALYGIAS
jgi:hypothetical protein